MFPSRRREGLGVGLAFGRALRRLRQMPTPDPSRVREGSFASPLNPRKIRNPVNRIAEPRQQAQTKRPLRRDFVIDHHAFEEGIDWRAQAGKRCHCAFEIFGINGRCGIGRSGVERGEEGKLLPIDLRWGGGSGVSN